MRFDVITIFPELIKPHLSESLLRRAIKNGLIDVKVHDLRKWGEGKHRIVDDKAFGGGIGMVLKIGPIYKALLDIKKKTPKKLKKRKVIVFGPRGKKFNQKMANSFSKLDQLIMICGRYEGIDERVAKYAVDEEISIGDYVLMGGEIPAVSVIEAVSRLIPGVIGINKPQILKERVTKEKGFIEYAQYTRPEVFKKWKVPKVLLSGHHKKISAWREKNCKTITD